MFFQEPFVSIRLFSRIRDSLTTIKLSADQEWIDIGGEHFEAVFGLSKIINLIPDRIKTAEELVSEKIECAFLFDSVISLVQFYIDMLICISERNNSHFSKPTSILKTYTDLKKTFRQLGSSLQSENSELSNTLKGVIDQQLVTASAYCTLFLNFARPIILERVNDKTSEQTEERAQRLMTRIQERFKMLFKLPDIHISYQISPNK